MIFVFVPSEKSTCALFVRNRMAELCFSSKKNEWAGVEKFYKRRLVEYSWQKAYSRFLREKLNKKDMLSDRTSCRGHKINEALLSQAGIEPRAMSTSCREAKASCILQESSFWMTSSWRFRAQQVRSWFLSLYSDSWNRSPAKLVLKQVGRGDSFRQESNGGAMFF